MMSALVADGMRTKLSNPQCLGTMSFGSCLRCEATSSVGHGYGIRGILVVMLGRSR